MASVDIVSGHKTQTEALDTNLERCPLCGQEDKTWEFFAQDIPDNEPPYQLVRCRGCGLGWTEPTTPDTEIARWYPTSYYGRENVRFHWFIEDLVRLFRLRRASVIRRWVPPGPVLDVGCGRGLMLGYLKSFGYQAYGLEVSEHAAWHAQHRMGAEVYVGDFLSAPYPLRHFHAVIFWHSLEHCRKPLETLRKAHALLKENGLLVVALPNLDSLQARLTGRNWFHLDIPRHYFHFSLKTLKRALSENGFRIVQVDHFSFEQNPYGWLQSLYNALGFKFNFLYSWIKNYSSRVIPLLRHPFQAFAMSALAFILVPLVLALTLLEALLKRGGTIEVYAIKIEP